MTFQPRDDRRCQTWHLDPVAGTATYTVSSADGRSACLTDSGTGGLRLVEAGRKGAECGAWTLVPTDDGTWSLASDRTTLAVRLLLP